MFEYFCELAASWCKGGYWLIWYWIPDNLKSHRNHTVCFVLICLLNYLVGSSGRYLYCCVEKTASCSDARASISVWLLCGQMNWIWIPTPIFEASSLFHSWFFCWDGAFLLDSLFTILLGDKTFKILGCLLGPTSCGWVPLYPNTVNSKLGFIQYPGLFKIPFQFNLSCVNPQA